MAHRNKAREAAIKGLPKRIEWKFRKKLNTVTWEELQDFSTKLKGIKEFAECVEEAKGLLAKSNQQLNRLQIAALCIRGVEIKKGGDRVTKEWDLKSGHTMVGFAKELGVHPRTMWTWVTCKRLADRLPKEIPVDMSTLTLVIALYNMKKLEDDGFLTDAYVALLLNSGSERDFRNFSRYLRYFTNSLRTKGLNGWDRGKLDEMETLLKNTLAAWESARSEVTDVV